ncbi:MAG TPA: TonB-dependent receptor [Terriglobia bacterium]|nr:TonB-dependent receptor [Terriglobia bacterium]
MTRPDIVRTILFCELAWLWFWTALPSAQAQQQAQSQHETIVVTGVFEPVPLEEADRPVDVIDARKLSLVSNSIVDFLRLDPSVDLMERGPNGTQADVSIRGGTFEQTLVLLNGFRMNDAQTGHHNMDLPLPLDAVSSVEILPGSGSTLYGSDALGGVVNFITRPPEATEVHARSAFGNFGVNQQSASITAVLDRLTEQLAFSRDFSTGFLPDRDYRNLEYFSNTHFTSRLGSSDLVLAHNDRPFGANDFYGNFDSWERTRTWFGSFKQGLGKQNEVSFAFRKHTDLFVLIREHPEMYTNHHALESYQAAFRRQERLRENARLFYGAEGFQDSIASNNLGNHTRGRLAAYLDFDVRNWRRFSFSLGAREEVYRTMRGEFVPALDVGYWVNSHLKLRGDISRSFRMPSMTDLYYHDPTTVGSPGLLPESAANLEAGLDWNVGSNLKGEITAFHRSEHNVIDYVRRSSADVWRASNIQQLTFRGIEASLKAAVHRSQELELRYAGLHGFQEQLDGLQTLYVFNYPLHSGVVSWQAALPGGLIARSRVGVLKRYGRDLYGVWDLYCARAAGRLHPFLQLTNLTDTFYQEIAGVPMPGRAVVVGMDILLLKQKK